MRWHSELGEDEFVNGATNLPAIGVYVDVGAADPFVHSHTAFLRAKGWTGLAVDGDPRWQERWKTPLRATVVSGITPMGFYTDDNPFNGRLDMAAPHVEPETLESLLISSGIEHVDLINLSTNGSEPMIWNTMDFERHQPDVVIHQFRGREALVETLANHYQMLATTRDTMVWYRRR